MTVYNLAPVGVQSPPVALASPGKEPESMRNALLPALLLVLSAAILPAAEEAKGCPATAACPATTVEACAAAKAAGACDAKDAKACDAKAVVACDAKAKPADDAKPVAACDAKAVATCDATAVVTCDAKAKNCDAKDATVAKDAAPAETAVAK